MKIQKISSGAPWEGTVGYSRAVRMGQVIEVSGTVSVKEGKIYGEGNPYLQAKHALEIIKDALEQAGAGIDSVIRTRVYITSREDWEEVGKAHGEVFGAIRPATSMIVVKELISPEFLVEIEATAIIEQPEN